MNNPAQPELKVLQAQGLNKHFGALKASDDVSIDVCPSEIHAVIGPNGAGKTTLIAQLCGSIKPDSGTISLLGKDITHSPIRHRARAGLARTFQISSLAMEDTVLQNALLGAMGSGASAWRFFKPVVKDETLLERAENALQQLGLHHLKNKQAAQLSHGQRRQLEVAIALTMNPRVFVMDEPMAGLGTEGSLQMTELLKSLKQQAPILLVEHDMEAVFALADRISVLVYGKIIATGTVEQIRNNSDVREAYLGDSA